jgi:uncharacterized HAD superfamily protein
MVLDGAVIVDIDGTLADCRHRFHLYEAKDYEAFNAASKDDEPIDAVVELVRNLPKWTWIVIMTARDESFRDVTMSWLNMNDIPFDQLLMRPAGDKRRDDIVKRELFNVNYKKEQVWFALEDRKVCVDMWRDEGITCLQVQEGNF